MGAGADSGDGGQKIGAGHGRRNLVLLVLALGAAAAVVGYYTLLGRQDSAELDRLERFRAAYAKKCDAPKFAEPTPPIVKDLYLTSSALQKTVASELTALESGASCDAVAKALRTADFPMLTLSTEKNP